MRPSACIVATGLLGLPALLGPAQENPLTRAFAAGTSASYRIQLTVRSELVAVRIEACDEAPCLSAIGPAGR